MCVHMLHKRVTIQAKIYMVCQNQNFFWYLSLVKFHDSTMDTLKVLTFYASLECCAMQDKQTQQGHSRVVMVVIIQDHCSPVKPKPIHWSKVIEYQMFCGT